VFVNHGEREVAEGFADLIRKELGWNVCAPDRGAAFEV
jgi:hypothetical protein